MATIQLQIDPVAAAAYIVLSDADCTRTEQVNDEVLVDLDEFDVVVGIEVLRLSAQIPFQQLVDQFHVHQDVIELLRRIQPNVSSFVMLTQGSEGAATAVQPRGGRVKQDNS